MIQRARILAGAVRRSLQHHLFLARRLVMPSTLRPQVRAVRRMRLTAPLPRRRRELGAVWGVTLVRDELDVLPHVIDHLFEQGIAHLLIADNRSVDGTREYLLERARTEPRLHVVLDEEPAHIQSEKMTWLSHLAWRAGADWIIPFDADEFWFAPEGTLATWVPGHRDGILQAAFHHMVPTTPAPEPLRDAEFMLDATPSDPGKVAFRAGPTVWVGPGNHSVRRTGTTGYGLAIAHAQYRSPAQVARKVRQGTASARLTGEDLAWFSPHWASAANLDDAQIAQVFDRISRGLPDPAIQYRAAGPMVRVRPLRWRRWDEDGTISTAGSETST